MAKRHKMSRRGSRKHFSKHASRIHKHNLGAKPGARYVMRGGIRK